MSGGLEIQKLCFRIGRFEMVGVDLDVAPGEYFVMTGPNGAGKSLLIKLICGIYRPSGGAIRINGRAVHDLPPWERRIGYVPQEGLLFPNRDVRRNIGFGLEVRRVPRRERRAAVERVVDLLGIAHLLDRRPAGLSGGERQKVSLARVLALEPDLLLLDEPVSSIDEETRDAVCRQLRDIQQTLKITALHVSHNRRETGLVADRVGVLRDGCVERTMPRNLFHITTGEMAGSAGAGAIKPEPRTGSTRPPSV